MDLPSTQGKKRSFWKKPEGITGALMIGGLTIAGGYGLYQILPTLLYLAKNTIYLGLMIGFIALVIYVVTNREFQVLASTVFKLAMRKLTNFFVTIEPIAVLRIKISEFNKSIEKMGDQISKLTAEIQKVDRQMMNIKKEHDDTLARAQVAKKNGDNMRASSEAAMLADYDAFYKELAFMRKKLEKLSSMLKKLKNAAMITVDQLTRKVDLEETRAKAIRGGYNAMQEAKSVLSGNSSQREMFDMAMEALVDEVEGKLASINDFMESSAGALDTIDLNNQVAMEKGMMKLEEIEKRGDTLLLGADNTGLNLDLSMGSGAAKMKVNKSKKKTDDGSSKFSDLF